jgi:hypothetical protein
MFLLLTAKTVDLDLVIAKMKSVVKINDEDFTVSHMTNCDYALEVKVFNLLLSLKIPVRIRGFLYLRDLTVLYLNDNGVHLDVHYENIAKANGTSWEQVQRCIRYAIDLAWDFSLNAKHIVSVHPRFFPSDIKPDTTFFFYTPYVLKARLHAQPRFQEDRAERGVDLLHIDGYRHLR